ncbi:hypothetical protein YC2023_089510 [Brassica napus]
MNATQRRAAAQIQGVQNKPIHMKKKQEISREQNSPTHIFPSSSISSMVALPISNFGSVIKHEEIYLRISSKDESKYYRNYNFCFSMLM